MLYAMALKLDVLLTLAIFGLLASASPMQRRQASPADIDNYIIGVKTAIYVIDNIQAGNSRSSCDDTGLESRLDSEGYDGAYAKQLL